MQPDQVRSQEPNWDHPKAIKQSSVKSSKGGGHEYYQLVVSEQGDAEKIQHLKEASVSKVKNLRSKMLRDKSPKQYEIVEEYVKVPTTGGKFKFQATKKDKGDLSVKMEKHEKETHYVIQSDAGNVFRLERPKLLEQRDLKRHYDQLNNRFEKGIKGLEEMQGFRKLTSAEYKYLNALRSAQPLVHKLGERINDDPSKAEEILNALVGWDLFQDDVQLDVSSIEKKVKGLIGEEAGATPKIVQYYEFGRDDTKLKRNFLNDQIQELQEKEKEVRNIRKKPIIEHNFNQLKDRLDQEIEKLEKQAKGQTLTREERSNLNDLKEIRDLVRRLGERIYDDPSKFEVILKALRRCDAFGDNLFVGDIKEEIQKLLGK